MAKAEAHGLKVTDVASAVAAADLVMILTPDEFQSALYKNEIEPNIKKAPPWPSPTASRSTTTRLCRALTST